MSRNMEVTIDKATAYTIHKGHMPKDVHELREWLREFVELESKFNEALMDAYKAHMTTCNRPLIMDGYVLEREEGKR
jgi:hypothetical protein